MLFLAVYVSVLKIVCRSRGGALSEVNQSNCKLDKSVHAHMSRLLDFQLQHQLLTEIPPRPFARLCFVHYQET